MIGVRSLVWAVGLSVVGALGLAAETFAQNTITPDDTLGADRSVIEPFNTNVDLIREGAVRGQNLFHSFEVFDVGNVNGAYFITDSDAINSILARVTGSNRSDILGVLGTRQLADNGDFIQSGADLYLINPNGVIFGPNAILDVGASFTATTADVIRFGAEEFSATNPEIPSTRLTINPSAYLFTRAEPADIESRSVTNGFLSQGFLGLRVPNKENITLLGGNITIDGGDTFAGLHAFGGRVEVAAIGGPGEVNIGSESELFFSESDPNGAVILTDRAQIDVTLDSGGDINITAGDIDINNESFLNAGIDSGFGFEGSQAGNIVVNATRAVTVASRSRIENNVDPFAIGDGGNIEIITNTIDVLNGAQLSSSTFGEGDAGNILITAADSVVFDGESADSRSPSTAFSRVAPDGVGDSGNIEITANTVDVLNGTQLLSSTFGEGDAGNILITAIESVIFDGENTDGRFVSAALSSISSGGIGDSGNIEIAANTLEVLNGAQLLSGTFGKGDAGSVFITAAENVVFDGGSTDGRFLSTAFSSVESGGVGDGGNVEITTSTLDVLNGAGVSSRTLGDGDAGNVLITATKSVVFDGASTDGQLSSAATSSVESGGVGDGGNVEIMTNTLDVLNGAQLSSSTFGDGDAGNVLITVAETVTFDGVTSDGQFASAAFSRVESGGVGDGGNIEIMTKILNLLNGAQLLSSTSGEGDAGNILVTATENVLFDGITADGKFASAAISRVEPGGVGDGGNVEIVANILDVLNGAGLSSGTFGEGDAGNVIIVISDQLLMFNSLIEAVSEASSGGEIRINAKSAILRGDSDIITSVISGNGNSGDITLTGDFIIAFDDSDILANADDGRGGDINLNVRGFFGENFTLDSLKADPETLEDNDRVDINATGAADGVIVLPDISFIENSLSDLSDTIVSPDQILIASCISRTNQDQGTFNVTGSGGLPTSPNSDILSTYPTSQIQSPTKTTTQWQLGDPVNEATGVSQLADGRLALSQDCAQH